MGTIRHEEVIFDELKFSKMRAIAGKCMMDINELYPDFIENTDSSLNTSYQLAEEFHNSNNGKLKVWICTKICIIMLRKVVD